MIDWLDTLALALGYAVLAATVILTLLLALDLVRGCHERRVDRLRG